MGYSYGCHQQYGKRFTYCISGTRSRSKNLCNGRFRGAGPLHASRLARGIGIPKVVIPAGAGVGSAIGLLEAEPRIDVSTTRVLKISPEVSSTIRSIFNSLEKRANEDMERLAVSGVTKWSRYAYMRYVGQGFEVMVHLPSDKIDEKYAESIISAFNSLI